MAKLRDGAKFDEVAREFSEDKARQGEFYGMQINIVYKVGDLHLLSGGSLGWKSKGSLDPQFEAVAFDLETSTTGNPKYVEVKTGFGYHIIMVEGRK